MGPKHFVVLISRSPEQSSSVEIFFTSFFFISRASVGPHLSIFPILKASTNSNLREAIYKIFLVARMICFVSQSNGSIVIADSSVNLS